MEITEVLNQIGLNQKESSVYLALLELGTADVSDIAKKAGIKRPTGYLILEDLKAKGMVSHVPAKIHLFTAESPEKLSGELYKKQELFKRFLPNILALYNAKKEKPQVRMYEGKEGISLVYDKIYKQNSVWFFGTTKEAQKYEPEGLWKFVKRTQEQNTEVRDLLTECEEDFAYAKKAGQGKNYHIRFLAKAGGFLTDNAIFGDSVVFFSFHPQIFAVEIQSREISSAVRVLFEFAWAAGKNYESMV